MLIAQITDLHIGFAPDDPDEPNLRRLRAVLDRLRALDPAPDLVLATGDLTDHGTPESYATLRAVLDDCPWPVWPAMGNHDRRESFRAAFPGIGGEGGFVHYEVDAGPVRILVADTLEEGRHGGGFCAARAAWLDAQLAARPDRPTVIVAHHPPVPSGIDWMTVDPAEAWVQRFHAVVARHPQVVRLLCGHIHRTFMAPFAGTTVWTSSAVAAQLALDFRPIGPQPDDRPMVLDEPPGYSLHHWDGRALISHAAIVAEARVLARYGAGMQPLVTQLLAERQSG